MQDRARCTLSCMVRDKQSTPLKLSPAVGPATIYCIPGMVPGTIGILSNDLQTITTITHNGWIPHKRNTSRGYVDPARVPNTIGSRLPDVPHIRVGTKFVSFKGTGTSLALSIHATCVILEELMISLCISSITFCRGAQYAHMHGTYG